MKSRVATSRGTCKCPSGLIAQKFVAFPKKIAILMAVISRGADFCVSDDFQTDVGGQRGHCLLVGFGVRF